MRLALGGCGFGGWSGLGSPFSIRVGWTIFSLPFDYGCGRCFLSLLSSVCATPTPFVLFASVFALLFARCRYLSVRPSVFGSSAAHLLNPVFYSAQFTAQSGQVLRHLPLTPTPSPTLLFPDIVLSPCTCTSFQIAELLHTVHTCLVLGCNMCIS